MRRFAAALPLVAIVLSIAGAYAQVPAPDEQGTKPFGSYYGSDIESVSMDSGHLVLNIPLYSLPQRGELKTEYYLTYVDSGFMQQNNQLPGCEPKTACPMELQILPAGSIQGVTPVLGGGAGAWVTTTTYNTGQTNGTYPYYEEIYQLHTSDYAAHTLAYSNGVYRAIDGSGWEYLPSTQNSQYPLGGNEGPTITNGVQSGTIIDSSGTQYALAQSGDTSNMQATDVNGNYMTLSGGDILSDSMGRAIPAPPSEANGGWANNTVAGCPNLNAQNQPSPTSGTFWQPPLYNGNPNNSGYLFCFTGVTVKTAFYPEDDPPDFEDLTRTIPMLQSIVLPDGKYWGFIYDSSDGSSTAYGDLVKIILPTGGTISYTWATAETCSGSGAMASFFRVVTSRTMTSSAGSEKWTYSTDGGLSASVTDPEGNQVQYTFTDESTTAIGCSMYETQRKYLQNESGTLVPVETVATQYTPVRGYDATGYSAAFPTQVTTTWNATGQSFVSKTQYDPGFTATAYMCAGPGPGPDNLYCGEPTTPILFGLPTSQSIDDYSGGLLRNTATSYEWESNSAYLAANLLNTPSQVTVTGSSGESQTNYSYDQSDQVGLSSGVSTMLGAPPTPGVYGHVTTTTQWLNVGGASPSIYTYWLNDGEVDHVVDAKGYTTSYQYSSDYDGAYRTETTNPLGQSVSAAYDFNTGLETSYTGLNTNTTTYNYDAMNRLTSVTDPDGGNTSFTYDPSGDPVNSVLIAKLMCSGGSNCGTEESSNQTETTLDVYDGFGRPSETELLSDPSNPVYTVTSYDALGNVESVTNPYRSTSDSTYGSTTYQYDMLGRKTQLQHEPDGSTEVWSYNGNEVTFTDENSNQWQRTSDALGRLTQVLEPNGTSQSPSMETDYTYDALGNLLTVAQWGGPSGSSGERLRTFNYDSLSRLLCASNPENSTGTCPATATGSYTAGTTEYVYDADGNVTTKTSPAVDASSGSQTIGYCYDKLNRVQYKFYSGSFSCSSPSGYADAYAYDTSSVSGSANDVGELTDEKAYIAGTLISERIPYHYDSMGRMTAERQIPYSPAGTAYQFVYDYDLAGNVTCANNGFAPSGYTGLCNSLSAGADTLADLYSYDSAGRLQWAKTSDLPSGFTVANYPSYLLETNESASHTAYDPMGHLISAGLSDTSAGGTANISLTRAYDPRGRITSESDTGQLQTLPAKQSIGTLALGGSEQQVTSSGTPGSGAVTISGTEESHTATVCGGPYRIVNGVEVPTCRPETLYDTGTVSITVSAFTASVSYGVGSTDDSIASALASALSASGSPVTASASGATITLTSLADGATSNYPVSISDGSDFDGSSSGSLAGGANGITTYDSGTVTVTVNGTSAHASWGEGSTSGTLASALASAINSAAGSFLSASASGSNVNLTSLAAASSTNWPISVTVADSDPALFSSASFTVQATGMQGGANPTDDNGVVYSYTVPSGGYDPVGNLKSYTDSVMGSWGYSYDTLNRLTGSAAGSGVPAQYANSYGCWSYDGFGNRTMEALWTGSASPCANGGAGANLQLTVTTPTTANQVSGYVYDDAGDVMKDSRNQYLYDAEGRICAVAGLVGDYEYLYDAEGYRVGKVAESSLSCGVPASAPTNEYLLGQGGQQVTELAPSGSAMTPLHTNVFTGGGLLATYDFPDGGVHFALTDPLGTRRVQVSGAGLAELNCISLPFGNDLNNTITPNCPSLISGATDATEQHYTQHERDDETGNDYFDARYYSSSVGRFLIPDWSKNPEGVPYADYTNPQTLDLYSYVQNNPLSRDDTDGHCGTLCFYVITEVSDFAASHPAVGNAISNVVSSSSVKAEVGYGTGMKAGPVDLEAHVAATVKIPLNGTQQPTSGLEAQASAATGVAEVSATGSVTRQGGGPTKLAVSADGNLGYASTTLASASTGGTSDGETSVGLEAYAGIGGGAQLSTSNSALSDLGIAISNVVQEGIADVTNYIKSGIAATEACSAGSCQGGAESETTPSQSSQGSNP